MSVNVSGDTDSFSVSVVPPADDVGALDVEAEACGRLGAADSIVSARESNVCALMIGVVEVRFRVGLAMGDCRTPPLRDLAALFFLAFFARSPELIPGAGSDSSSIS
jgi:hypothetical protein